LRKKETKVLKYEEPSLNQTKAFNKKKYLIPKVVIGVEGCFEK